MSAFRFIRFICSSAARVLPHGEMTTDCFCGSGGLPAELAEIFSGFCDAFHPGQTHRRLILLDDYPFCTCVYGGGKDCGHVLHTTAARTELERGGLVVLLIVVQTDEGVEMLRELAAHVEVLQMNHRRATRVFAHEICRIFSADIDPAGVQLRLEIGSRNLLVENIETVFAVNLLEFKVVVVVE